MPDIVIAGYPKNLVGRQVTVPNGATAVSEAIAMEGMTLVGISMPATWVAADIGYQVSWDNSNFQALESNATPVTTKVTQARYIPIAEANWFFMPFLKIASVTAGTVTAVNQTADRLVTLFFKKALN